MVAIAIDGPGGSGKSTISRRVAGRLGLPVLDTGAMYRAVTLLALRRGIALDDAAALAAASKEMDLAVEDTVVLDGEDVSAPIRSAEVDAAVSVVAAHPEVRAELVRRQREWVERHGGGVIEGRDIGTVVLPHAEVKVYLTASTFERARRRASERGDDGAVAEMQAAIARRDGLDQGREFSPLVVAPGAVEIDSTGRSIDEVVEQIVGML